VNASPDFSVQVQGFPDLHPQLQPPRNSPIAGVLLTNADLDHVLGLFSLRESGAIEVHASGAVRATIESSLHMHTVLDAFGTMVWHEPPIRFAPLPGPGVEVQALLYRAIELPGKPPPFAQDAPAGAQSLAYQFVDSRTGGRLLIAPDVAAVTDDLREALETSDALLFDGTFWSSEELAAVRPRARKASDMGHVTIQDCSLNLLKTVPARWKIYIHINNTNPILAPGTAERSAVEAAGITVGWDGLEFEL
jgi:pyrroloquinoline quinone biosynthesis protein B